MRSLLQTYLFYDIETTGLNKSFDQVLQFAAIRTDLALKELDRYEINVKLNPDIIPSPHALITHHIGLNPLPNAISEWDALKKIHQYLNHPGTISLGYNTLGFDDEFLRFSFYRNLLPPYTHQFANQCSRMDLYPMTLMYFLFKPNVLTWPNIEGKLSLKLEQLNLANQLAAGRAHDAMVDVEATLALAQRFFQESEMWNYLKDFFNKKIEQERLQPLCNNAMGIMLDGCLSHQRYQSLVLHLGQHQHYKNQSLWLLLDTPELTKTTPDKITETTRVIRKKPGEPCFILPLKERFIAKLLPEQLALAEENKKWLEANPDQLKQIIDYYSNYQYPSYPDADIEAGLYMNGFYSSEEEQFCRLFHRVSSQEKSALTDKLTFPKLQELAIRVLGRHFPDAMNTAQKERFSAYIQRINHDVMIDFQGKKRTTPASALHDISDIREKKMLSEAEMVLLDELESKLEMANTPSSPT
jgi:exodeoxyribonuclease-1